jgi:Uma2 family endonuclease
MTPESTRPRGPSKATQRFLLRDLPWHSYETLLDELRCQPIRLTYDRGSLELLDLSDEHRMHVRLVARLIGTLAKSLEVPILSGKPTTFKRRASERGLEPDSFYYFGDELPGRGVREILPDYDLPPDLAVEIDLERSSLDRLGIYAALGFPEVWRHDGNELRVHQLRGDGRYTASASSPRLPFPHLTAAVRLLRECETMGDTGLVPSLPGWIRREADRRLRGSTGDGIQPAAADERNATAPADRPANAAWPSDTTEGGPAWQTHAKGVKRER